jgi:hypothetical protein
LKPLGIGDNSCYSGINEIYRRTVPHERTGRPLESERFVKQLEKTVDRIRQKQNPGRKKRGKEK